MHACILRYAWIWIAPKRKINAWARQAEDAKNPESRSLSLLTSTYLARRCSYTKVSSLVGNQAHELSNNLVSQATTVCTSPRQQLLQTVTAQAEPNRHSMAPVWRAALLFRSVRLGFSLQICYSKGGKPWVPENPVTHSMRLLRAAEDLATEYAAGHCPAVAATMTTQIWNISAPQPSPALHL